VQVHGTSAGGDADELRLLSTSNTYINLRAHGGSLDFLSTKIRSALRFKARNAFSWDTSTNAPDEDQADGRSYISAVSEVITDDSQTCRGRAKTNMGEARMDIEDSEMGYLGYQGSEAYGLTWKIRYETATLRYERPAWKLQTSEHRRLDGADGSHIELYSTISGTRDTSDGSTNCFVNSGDPYVRRAFTMHKVTSTYYYVLMPLFSLDDISMHVPGNYVHDAGLAMMKPVNADVSDNIFGNNKYCVRSFIGCGRNQRLCQVRSSMTGYNAYAYLGSDAPDVVESERSQENFFPENTIVGGIETLKIMDADGTEFIGNSFEDAVTIRFDDAVRTVMSGNTGPNDTKLKVNNGASFDKKSDYGFEPIY
ncbi:unnamed protein product, partial [Laminaria digitata]